MFASHQLTSPIGFRFWNFRYRLVRYYWYTCTFKLQWVRCMHPTQSTARSLADSLQWCVKRIRRDSPPPFLPAFQVLFSLDLIVWNMKPMIWEEMRSPTPINVPRSLLPSFLSAGGVAGISCRWGLRGPVTLVLHILYYILLYYIILYYIFNAQSISNNQFTMAD